MKTMKQVTDEYNAIVLAAGQGLMNTVIRFSDLKTAQHRLAALKEKYPNTEATADPSAPPEPPTKTTNEEKASTLAKKKKGLNPFGSVAAMKIKYNLLKANPNVTRKEYIAAATAVGIKKSTADRQWQFNWEYLNNRFGGDEDEK